MITPTTEQIQYAKYKWEFLRRKPKFLAYCKKYRANGEDYIPIDRPWGLTRIIDPSLSYEEHVKRFDEDNTMRSQEDSSTDEFKS
jgi:hypothetical protein